MSAQQNRDTERPTGKTTEELGSAASWGSVVQANRPEERLEEFGLWLDSNFALVTTALPDTLIATVALSE